MEGAPTVDEATRRLVEDTIHAVARSIDEDRLEALPDYFLADATYRIASRFNLDRGLPLAPVNCTSRAMLADRIAAMREANVYHRQHYRHVISGIVIVRVAGNELEVRSNYIVVRTLEDGSSTLFSSGEYRDRMVIEGERALFRERLVVFDSKAIDTLLVIPI